jgi:hypothetical protein
VILFLAGIAETCAFKDHHSLKHHVRPFALPRFGQFKLPFILSSELQRLTLQLSCSPLFNTAEKILVAGNLFFLYTWVVA